MLTILYLFFDGFGDGTTPTPSQVVCAHISIRPIVQPIVSIRPVVEPVITLRNC